MIATARDSEHMGHPCAARGCREVLERLCNDDLDGWVALCDERVALEFPFAPRECRAG